MGNDLSQRIKDCMAAAHVNNEQLAAACGVKPPTSFHWASGKTKKIKAEPLLKAAKLFGVTPEWLSTGSQPKYLSDGQQSRVQAPQADYLTDPKLDKMTTEIVILFNQLDKASKLECLGQIRGFVLGRLGHDRGPPAEQVQPANNRRTGTHS